MREFNNLTRYDWYDAAPPLFPVKRYGTRALVAAGLIGFALGWLACAMGNSSRPAQTHKQVGWMEALGAGRN